MNLIDTIVEVAEGLEGRPSWDEYFMATAFLIATRSACQRLNVGCVIVSKGTHKNRIIAAGYNGFLPGAPHISRVDNDHEQSTVHAEQNAISDAARRGVLDSGVRVVDDQLLDCLVWNLHLGRLSYASCADSALVLDG